MHSLTLCCPPPLLSRRRTYLSQLRDYLVSFYERTQPLAQLGKQLDKLTAEVADAWAQGQVRRGRMRCCCCAACVQRMLVMGSWCCWMRRACLHAFVLALSQQGNAAAHPC